MIPELSTTTGKNVQFLLQSHAEKRPNAPFLHWAPHHGDDATYSYGQFYKQTISLAAGLRERGINPGDFVLLHANNSPEFLLTWYACAFLGAVVVTTNPRSSSDEMNYFISHSKPRCVVTQPSFLHLFNDTDASYEWVACTDNDSGAPAENPLPDSIIPFVDLFADGAAFLPAELDDIAPLSIQYTSGTTSRPKGVVWTHANALWAAHVGASHKAIRSDDTAMVTTPLCHTNAMSWSHLPVLWSGGAMALAPKFSASRYWDTALKYDCTWGTAIPFVVQALMQQPVPSEHPMRFWIVGAANIGPLDEHFGVDIIGAWGMTETVIHATYTPPQLPSPPLSIGIPMPQYDIKVVREDGTPTNQHEPGLLKIRGIRGVSLFLEYLHNPEATEASFDADGWFDTGDRVMRVEHGHLKFIDRTKDMLKVGAENVAAVEIESVINAVEGVIESAVVARPDKMRDEVPVAFVRVAAPSSTLKKTILDTCEQKLSDFKRPVAIVFCEDFPRAELNKVAKGKLRKQAAALKIN